MIAIGAAALGCSTESEPGDVESLFVVPASFASLAGASFFDHPWPSDLRLEAGSPRFEGYYNPRQVPILDEYTTSMKGVLDGFSPIAAGYVRFTGALDAASLPQTPVAGLDPAASVQLVDIDPASPEHGQRKLVSLSLRNAEGVYWRGNTLAFIPTMGFPLRPRTRYALVVTDAVRASGGAPVVASAGLRQALGVDAASGPGAAAKAAMAPAVGELAALGIAKEHVVQLAVFTTADPTAELYAFRDALHADVEPPVFRDASWNLHNELADYDEYWGEYGPSPNYQAGTLPFEAFGDGGQLNLVDGKPTVVDLFDLRFSLSVPNASSCPPPDGGYPIVLFAHGSGGDYRNYVTSGIAKELAQRCMASMGVDQIFHGKRPGAPKGGVEKDYLLYFNFQNIVAARTNARQSALDEVQRARLFTTTLAFVPKSISASGADVHFDPTKVMFFGHSQGGQNGPLFLAADDAVRGGVMSGSGGVTAIALLEKSKPDPSVAGLVASVFLALKPDEVAELSVFHPAISLAQMITDVVDPVAYGRNQLLEPRPGFAPKSYLMTEGVDPDGRGDSYAPPRGIEALAMSIGLPVQLPQQHPVAESEWGGPAGVSIPDDGLAGNLAGGAASGVLAQWAVPAGDDGHFVVFSVEAAKAQAAKFLRNLSRESAGRVPAP